MERRKALVTNVLEYGGPGTVTALEKAGYAIACHDNTFTDPRAREAYHRPGDRIHGRLALIRINAGHRRSRPGDATSWPKLRLSIFN